MSGSLPDTLGVRVRSVAPSRAGARGAARKPSRVALALAVLGLPAWQAGAQSTPTAPSSAQAPQASVAASPWDAPEPWRTDRFYVQTSLYTAHFHPDPDHNNYTRLFDLSYRLAPQWIVGGSLFSNSFGQFSQYLYGGWVYRPLEPHPAFYLKVTAGLVHGYKEPYEEKIPFNNTGVAPVIIPSVGYCVRRYCSELVLFGAAGAMLTLGVTLP